MKENIQELHKLLIEKKLTLSLAESCTGGYIASNLIENTGASNYFKLGLVVYSVESKIKLCNIREEEIFEYGVVSEKIALLLANNVRKILTSDIGLGITGIAGPDDGDAHPSGTAFLAINYDDKINTLKLFNDGSRVENIKYFTEEAIKLLFSVLL